MLVSAWVPISTALPASEVPKLAPQQEQFKDYKLGLFIHFGAYSTPTGKAIDFNPVDFNAHSWVATARSAGARYITFTSKHHEGFCLFDSRLTDFTSAHMTAKKDLVGELAAECHRQEMPLFIYYSPLDYHQPDFNRDWPAYLRYWHGQLRELATNYGELAGFWLDVGPSPRPLKYQMYEAAQLLHELQPGCLVMAFDFYETERSLRQLGFFNREGQDVYFPMPAPSPEAYPWEVCDTINDSWGYNPKDTNHKSSNELIRHLVQVVGRGGNLLLNSGPMPSGQFQPEHIERLKAVGAWMKRNGEAIYGTRPLGAPVPEWGLAVSKGNHVYLHVLNWPGNELVLKGLTRQVKSVSLYQRGPLEFVQKDEVLTIQMPDSARDSVDTIVALTTDK
ncbi:MAG: alpha-L-fucosidase [Candidatus Omnitrophica bacterium]|nr:alpha-L-fucosidase [Candidatus Omnitrophota bacterium]